MDDYIFLSHLCSTALSCESLMESVCLYKKQFLLCSLTTKVGVGSEHLKAHFLLAAEAVMVIMSKNGGEFQLNDN